MQGKSEKFSEYSERTEMLASDLGLNLSDLPLKIGVSASMFHAYRSGKHPISGKAWRKLEEAESRAQFRPGRGKIGSETSEPIAISVTNPNNMGTTPPEKSEESEHSKRRIATLAAARERDRQLLVGAEVEIVEVLREVEHYLETMVIRDAAGRSKQIELCADRIAEFDEWVESYRGVSAIRKGPPIEPPAI